MLSHDYTTSWVCVTPKQRFRTRSRYPHQYIKHSNSIKHMEARDSSVLSFRHHWETSRCLELWTQSRPWRREVVTSLRDKTEQQDPYSNEIRSTSGRTRLLESIAPISPKTRHFKDRKQRRYGFLFWIETPSNNQWLVCEDEHAAISFKNEAIGIIHAMYWWLHHD